MIKEFNIQGVLSVRQKMAAKFAMRINVKLAKKDSF